MTKASFRMLRLPLAGAVLLAACSSGGDDPIIGPPAVIVPKSGTALVSLSSTGGPVGAIRVRVAGAGLSVPLAKGTAEILTRRTVGDTTVFVISTRGVANGDPVLELKVADLSAAFAASVVEATGGREQGYAAIAPSAVTLAVARQ